MSRKDDVPYNIKLCPVCSCPVQRMADKQGNMTGTLQDALDAHSRVVHPGEPAE